ncbi:MAG TPA: PA domain-containing protein [Thermoanaerobaculia bacterium]|nr:PA domain-containing protein [Thermoanaerobaculia bacterium]
MTTKLKSFLLIAAVVLMPMSAFANATIVIVNNDPAGVGFNDPTPAAPVGGNPGTTLGQQRLNAFEYAADLWEAKIDSVVPIRVRANFGPLSCNATSATLGSAGARGIWANTANIREANTWYHVALVNKQAGYDIAPVGSSGDEVDIGASFNSNIGTPGCLQTSGGWYYGLDTNTPANKINLVAVLLHEFAHGLGFSTFVNRTNGTNVGEPSYPWPDVYQKRIFDQTANLYWDNMSPAQRLASRVNTNNLSWDGPNVKAAAPAVLNNAPVVRIDSPSSIAGTHLVGVAVFGAPLALGGISGELVHAVDAANAAGPLTSDGCTAITNNISGKIAFMNRGTCGFAIKVKNAQDAGAIAVVIGDNAASVNPADMGSSGNAAFDATVTIPSGRVTLAVANTLRSGLSAGAVHVNLGLDASRRAGADAMGRVLLYSPNPFVSGSSVSHFDTTASRNVLMEPNISSDLTHNVSAPYDLTLEQFRDIGWYPDADVDLVEDAQDNCPNAANADQANYDGDAQGDACDSDDDNDGVADANDANPFSNMQANVVIGTCNSNAPNVVFPNGETMMDRIAAITASNHGQFVSAISALTNEAKSLNLLTGAQKGSIQSCAAGK